LTVANLLIVDDEPAARSTLALLLRKRGHHVLEADGLPATTKRLGEEVFDLVVTDLKMPDGDGLDVLRAVKAQAPHTEVILLTAYAGWRSAKEAMRLGALDYFEKGDDPDELYHRIDRRWPNGRSAGRTRTSASSSGSATVSPASSRCRRPCTTCWTWSSAWRRPTPPC
jgi:DNA-binding NtrC family response regulator